VHLANGAAIHHDLGGGRRVEVERGDHSRIVAERGGRGFVQHPYMYGGREFGHRTYYEHGRAYDRFYARNYYRGVYVDVYAPARYYPVGFYGWAYNPWAAPVAFSWGFAPVANPWFGYYGAYFTPLPVYPTPALWLTDYMISNSLAAAYQARVDAGIQQQALVAPAPLTPDVRALIAAEVQRQIALENTEAQSNAQNAAIDPNSSGIARMLGDNASHVFVVGQDLDLTDANNQECAVSEGDVLQLTTPPPANAPAATLVVLGSKGGVECRKGAAVSVGVADLQNMQNHMRETIDAGLGDLQSKQGQGGLPAAPASAKAAPAPAQFAALAPPPDPDVANQINQQAQEADKGEQEALGQATGGAAPAPAAAPGAPPPTLTLGLSTDQVTGMLGAPKQIVDLGAKKIYVYKDMKVTFNDGKVSDIQ
jgi:hypothetical protein